MSVAELIYDWNTVEPQLLKPDRHIGFDDETLRDGLQSPSVCDLRSKRRSSCCT